MSLDVGEFDVFSLHIFHSMPLLFLQWYHTFFLSLRPHRGESSAVAGVCACVCVCVCVSIQVYRDLWCQTCGPCMLNSSKKEVLIFGFTVLVQCAVV